MASTTASILALLAGVLLAGAGVAGCGDDDPPKPPAPRASDPLVSVTKSGGIAGIEERLVISGDGEATVRNRDEIVDRFKIPRREFKVLSDNLAAHPIGEFDPPPDNGCADCFVYSVSYQGGSYEADQISLKGGAREVIGPLLAILAAHNSASAPSGAGSK